MIRRLTGGRQKPTRTSKTKVKKQDNFKGTGNKKPVPTKATTDSKGLVTLSSPKTGSKSSSPTVQAKRKSVAADIKEIKSIREKLAAQGSDGKGKGITSKESVKEGKAKAHTGMGSDKSGAMGRGSKKPKGGWITKTKGKPRI